MKKKKYFAFISYSHKDSEMAKWLQHEFEYYELPATLFDERKDLHKEDLPESFRPIFRDEDELSGGELKPQISKALADSEYLIVVCSPYSAQSPYVDSEIKEFIGLAQENKRRIFPFIVDGKPHQEDDNKEKECFPKTLLELSEDKAEPVELIADDIHATGRDHAFVKILAGTLNEKDVRFADLWNRYAIEKAAKERKEREDKEKLQIAQSRFIAEKANQLVDEGDSYLAKILALKALPTNLENPERPYVVEAESALRKAVLSHSGILSGHTSYTSSAFFSPNGKFVVSASNDKSVRIWDAETGQQIGLPLNGHELEVTFASFSPDGKRIVSASYDKTIRIWNAQTGKQIGNPLEGHTDVVTSAAFSPDGKRIVSASYDKTIRIWDAQTEKQIGDSLEGHTKDVLSALFSPNGKHIVSASYDKTIRIWDAETGICIRIIEGHSSSVQYASFSPDGKRVVSASDDNTIRVWDVEIQRQIGLRLKGNIHIAVSSTFLSPDSKQFVTMYENAVHIFDIETGECLRILKGHTNSVNSVSFDPMGKRIISASDDKTIRIWDVQTGKQIGDPLEGHTWSVNSASFSPDGKRIVSASRDETIRIWDVETGRQIGDPLEGLTDDVVAFSPDGKLIISSSGDSFGNHTICIWDAHTRKQINAPLKGRADWVTSASFSPDGKCIVLPSWEIVRVWDMETGRQIGEPLKGHSTSVKSAAFSPDGKHIVSASDDNSIRIWDVNTRQQIGQPLEGHTKPVTSANFSPDGKRIVSTSLDQTIRIWDVETGRQIGYSLDGYTFYHKYAFFSHDGRNIVSVSNDSIVCIWDFPPLQELIDQTRERFKDRQLTSEERRKYYLE